MAIDPGPHLLDVTRPIFGPPGKATLHEVTPTFYPDLDKSFPNFGGHYLIQQFAFSEPWGMWEMHPKGDEFVYLLAGDVDFLLKAPSEEPKRVRVHEPGSYVIVPQGYWHTAEPNAPTSMLFVTAGEGTMNEAEPLD
jgi:mannose-6-phosphate isomerase-like protein (cupin superfamily)